MDRLVEFVDVARQTVASGYYPSHGRIKSGPGLSRAIRRSMDEGVLPILAEVKPASPTQGRLVEGSIDGLVARYVADGATGLSVLTEPTHFHGSLTNLRKAVATGLPTLMKDFIIDEQQIDCAAEIGASAVLLIASILPKKRIAKLIEYAQLAGREVVWEAANRKEYEAGMDSEADIVGINNRDLRSMQVDLERTIQIAQDVERTKPVLALSGIESRADVERLASHVDGFLVGTSLIQGATTIAELRGA